MLAFINPLFLYAAAAVAAPVLFHLLLRNRPQRRILPTMRFLPNTAQQSVAMHRLKNIILLALRVLAVLLLVLAFARPYTAQPAVNEAKQAEQGAVFAVDASMSMRARDRWSAALSRVSALNRVLPQDSLRAVVLFDRTPSVICAETSDVNAVESALSAAQAGFGSTDLVAGIRTAVETAASLKATSRRVYLISDFQNAGFKQIGVNVGLPEGVELLPTKIAEGDTLPNATIVTCIEVPDAEDQVRHVRVQLEFFGGKKLSGALNVAADGKDLESRNVQFDAPGRVVEDLKLALPPQNEYVLTVTLEVDDGLKEDNTLTTILPAHVSIPLMVCTPSDAVASTDAADPMPGANPFLKAAVAAFGNKVATTWTTPSQTMTPTPNTFRAIIVNSGDALARESRDALKKYVEDGGVLILFPGENDVPILEELVGVATEGWESYANQDQYQLVTYVSSDAALPSLSESGNTLLGFPKAFRYLKMGEPAQDEAKAVQAVVRLDNGRPFLVARKLGRGTVYLFATPLNPKASDLVLRAGFSPFLYQLLEHGMTRIRPKQSFMVGDTLVDAPEGAMLTTPGNRTVNGGDVRQALTTPGVYRLRAGDSERLLSVRADPEESDLTPMDADRIALLEQGSLQEGGALVGMAKAKAQEERSPDAGQNMWWYLVLTAVMCLVIESLLASRTSR